MKFFSEAVQCYAKIYLPKGFTAESKAPGVVLAPAPGDTAASIDSTPRSWPRGASSRWPSTIAAGARAAVSCTCRSRCGGTIGCASRSTPRRCASAADARCRDAQILDIRNAISHLQGEPGVDRARIGLWGVDLAGGHAIVTAGVDFRVKAAVAQTPIIDGQRHAAKGDEAGAGAASGAHGGWPGQVRPRRPPPPRPR